MSISEGRVVIGWGVGGDGVADQAGLWGTTARWPDAGGRIPRFSFASIPDPNARLPEDLVFESGKGTSEAQLTIGDSGAVSSNFAGGRRKLAGLADLAPNGMFTYDNASYQPGRSA